MTQISSNIYHIGVDDDNLDLFEGQYPLTSGISYNSYLIDSGTIAIVDAVDTRRTTEWLARLSDALGTRVPDYLIVQHMEPDHSGSIRAVMERYPDMKIVATAKAIAMLGNFFEGLDLTGRTIAVGDGDTLRVGSRTLRFITAPMVHWPEVMFTLDISSGTLFSADAFGSFATMDSAAAWPDEARRYYANIVGKYGTSVQSVLKKLEGKGIKTIAPLHGPVLHSPLNHYVNLYHSWSRYEPETRGTLVAYASIYGGTAEAARLLAGMLRDNPDAGEVVLLDLCRHDVSYAVGQAFRLDKMALCSVTYDASLFPAMYNFLHHLELKGMRGRKVGLVENGSWAPIAGKLMAGMLDKMKDMQIVEPTVTIRSRVHSSDIAALRSLADALVKA